MKVFPNIDLRTDECDVDTNFNQINAGGFCILYSIFHNEQNFLSLSTYFFFGRGCPFSLMATPPLVGTLQM